MSGETFWRSRSWAFSDSGLPALVTAEEFLLIVRERYHIPVMWTELTALTKAGRFRRSTSSMQGPPSRREKDQ